MSVSAQAVTGAVQVLTQDDCPWTVTSNATWITIAEDDRSGLGGRAIHYQVAANTSPTARERTVRLTAAPVLRFTKPGPPEGAACPSGMISPRVRGPDPGP